MEISTFSAHTGKQSWIIPQARPHSLRHHDGGYVHVQAKDRHGKVYQVRLSPHEVKAIRDGHNLNIA